MLRRCQIVAPKHRFKFDEKVYLLDATIINLCLAAFPWARMLKLPKGSLVVFDKGFTDCEWWQELTINGILLVTRLKDNALVEYLRNRHGRKAKGVVLDREIRLKGMNDNL